MIIQIIKKSVSATLVTALAIGAAFSLIEPSSASAVTATSSVVVTLNVTAGVSITSPSNSTMSTALGVSQNTAVGTTTWNVKTNSATGYTLTVQATSTPAMNSTTTVNSIADYQTGAPNTWTATSGFAYFGYSAFGTDVSTGTWGTDTDCYSTANVQSTALKYKGFTTSGFQIATRASTTTPSGVDATVCYAVEQNNTYIPAGNYQATITATATAS